MGIQNYVLETESFKELCPNCSRNSDDFVRCVDRYGRENVEGGEGHYCARCGFCFETD